MELTACTLKHIKVFTVAFGKSYYGGVDHTGLELPMIDLRESDDEEQRTYKCDNCSARFDGSEDFEGVKKHLGGFGSWVNRPNPIVSGGKYE